VTRVEPSGEVAAGHASVTITRRIEWIDTDAAGIYHWSTLCRFVEAAEAVLHDRLGIREQTFGLTPRVHFEVDFRSELRFFDEVMVRLAVSHVGRTSVRYAFAVERDGASVAVGELVTVYVERQPGGKPTPWPDDIRERLEHGGDQTRRQDHGAP
jgi:acyl-CoA thioester hydrolase